jgi:acetolactate synthase-1/2/3 large subunit
MLDSIPMVAITGNVPCSLIGKDSFQEIDITGITLPITKHNYFVHKIEDLAPSLREAFRIAKSGRPGPVLLDIPKDVQIATYEYEAAPVEEKTPLRKPKDEEIERAVKLINESKRPYIYIGGGAAGLGLGKEIVAFAEKIDACVGCTFMGLSAIPTDSTERFLGMQGMHGHYASSISQSEADLILGIGVRFSDRATGNVNKYAKNSKIIQLDPDFSEIRKNVKTECGIVGDVEYSFRRIAEAAEASVKPEWSERFKELKADEARIQGEIEALGEGQFTPSDVFEVINKRKLPRTIIATDVGQHQMWSAQMVKFDTTRRFVSSGGLGTMGFGLGAAIGARVATSDPTVLITGDGSFGMNLNELATAVSHRIPLVIVLINNGVLGMVRQWQTLFFGGRYSNTVLGDRKTDFVKLAEAFGAKGFRATTKEEFDKAFTEAVAMDEVVLIDTVIDKDDMVLPMLPPGGSVEDIITKLKGKEDA